MKKAAVRMFLAFTLLALVAVSSTVETPTLTNIRQTNEDGFKKVGSRENKYAFSMVVFNDFLYVGTLNIIDMPAMFGFFSGGNTEGGSGGAEVWRYRPADDGQDVWTNVVDEGLGDDDNIGVRKMIAAKDALWGVTANHQDGMEVWRSTDGEKWEQAAVGGFGDRENTSGRGLGLFNDIIYVGTENRRHGAQIWRSPDGRDWEKVADGGLSDKGNWWFSDFAEYKGRLYMGTLNVKGCQIWRTHDGRHFQRVAQGGLEKKTNFGAMKLYVYKERLFVGTMDFFNGFDLYVTDDGAHFTRLIKNGLTDEQNGYLWQLQEFNGRLYAGTYYHSGAKLPTGRFQLFSSEDGLQWTVETDDAFGHEWQYGVRSMAVYRDKLIIGTASPQEGCKVFEASAKSLAMAP